MFIILMHSYCLSGLNPCSFKVILNLSEASIKKRDPYLVWITLLRCPMNTMLGMFKTLELCQHSVQLELNFRGY